MKDTFDGLAKLADVFFNGASTTKSAKGITIQELIRRKSSVIVADGKLYRVTVESVAVEVKK